MSTTTIGILAHVDAGKTSLTERILFETGVIGSAGAVDAGTTQTDTLEQERARGITIKAAVATFVRDDRQFALIDTPGHADFIAEVERSLAVLDGVVLVISAVEGIQAQTRKLARAIQSANLPLAVFINKIDRIGARELELVHEIRARLALPVLPLNRPVDSGSTAAAISSAFLPGDPWHQDRVDLLATHSDALIEHSLGTDDAPPDELIESEILMQLASRQVVPALFGSATLGIGVDQVLEAIARVCPAPDLSTEADPSVRVFKVQHTGAGERLVLGRVVQGNLKVRSKVGIIGNDSDPERITAIDRFVAGSRVPVQRASAGEIVCLHGLKTARIGDVLGAAPGTSGSSPSIASPPLESTLWPTDPAQRQALHLAMEQLADGDPFIAPRLNPRTGEIAIRLFGEVQTEVITETLRADYGIAVAFGEPRPVCVERPIGSGSSVMRMADADNPYIATVGLRIDSAPPDSGITYDWEPGSLPPAYYRVIEETMFATLLEGLHGWEVRDCRVSLTEVGYASPVTTGSDFRRVTPMVVMSALDAAGVTVCQPIDAFEVVTLADVLGDVIHTLITCGASPVDTTVEGDIATITGTVPAINVGAIERRIYSFGRGTTSFATDFLRYDPVPGDPPERARTSVSALNRTEYTGAVSAGKVVF